MAFFRRRVFRTLAIACLALAAGACASPLSTRPGEVTLMSDSGSPISGAIVRADPIDPRHPLNISDYLRSDPRTLGVWHTDAKGHATITLLRDRPTSLTFAALGYLPDSMLIDPAHPSPFRLTLTPLSENARNPR